MVVSRSWREGSSSDATRIFASSCGSTRQPRPAQASAPIEGIATGQNLPAMVRPASTYVHKDTPAEAGAAIEPVIVLELVDLDALAIVGRWRY